MSERQLLTMAEVAQVLLCSKAHVCNAVNGKLSGCTPLPVLRLGRRLLVRRESLERWISENEVQWDGRMSVSPERGRKSA